MSKDEVNKTTVVNIRKVRGKAPEYDVYIGRANRWTGHKASKWQNPFPLSQYKIDECLKLYEARIRSRPELIRALPELAGKRLGCWCKPAPCHGDVLIKLLHEFCASRIADSAV